MKNDPDKKQDLLERDFFQSMSPSGLKELGVGDVAYVRHYVVKGRPAFILHAADGTAIAAQDNEVSALEAADDYNLDLVTVH